MITFDNFADFIKEYIYKEGWQNLRQVQIDAAEIIFNEDVDLLITTQTASGKTEAAMFPIITNMHNNPKKGIRTLYISPLKALINDQFIRLNDMLFNAGIKVFRWHGDVSSYQKEKALNTDNTILQITPESLESLFINHFEDLEKLFTNLDYIVIDEVHYFLDSTRGIQMMSLIERIERLINRHVRRIGLSATIGNEQLAANFISSNNSVRTLNNRQEKTKVRLAVMYNKISNNETKQKYYQDIYKLINGKKTIVFANSKRKVEDTAHNLKKINEKFSGNNYILVHHGNISKVLRDEVETKMKNSDIPITAVATMTLELGIDLGKLERVVQIDAPISINSFVQRLGRTGRRDGIKEMCFAFGNEVDEQLESSPIDWSLLYTIALINLYTKEKYIESIEFDLLPYGVCLQQTLSILANYPGINVKKLAEMILSTSVFKNIPREDYKLLLNYAIKCNLIEQCKDNNQTLYLGIDGERIINFYDFYSVFKTEKDYEVICNNKVIGSIQKKLPFGTKFNLAGSTWEIINEDKKNRTIYVKESNGLALVNWEGSGLPIVDNKVMKELQQILKNRYEFAFLTEHAKETYINSLNIYNETCFIEKNFTQIDNNEYAYFPFVGTKEFLTLYYLLRDCFITKPVFDSFIPLCLIIKTNNLQDVIDYINNIHSINEIKFDLNFAKEGKYDEYIPEQLLRKAFCAKTLDLNKLKINI